jgi:hypothetical protein
VLCTWYICASIKFWRSTDPSPGKWAGRKVEDTREQYLSPQLCVSTAPGPFTPGSEKQRMEMITFWCPRPGDSGSRTVRGYTPERLRVWRRLAQAVSLSLSLSLLGRPLRTALQRPRLGESSPLPCAQLLCFRILLVF